MREKPDCDNCREIKRRKFQEPPCMDCRPFLMEQNQDAVTIYTHAASQVIVAGMGVVLDINHNALEFLMNLYNVTDKKGCFEKVVKTFHYFLGIDRQGSG